MRTRTRLFYALAAPLTLSALLAFRPTADTREMRELPAFSAVRLGTRATVIVRQGSPQRVLVEAAPADLPKLHTEVVNNQLRIYTEMTSTQIGPLKFNPHTATLTGPVTVYVTLPTVRGLAVSSSGRLQVDTLQAQHLTLGVSSSGRLLLGQVQAGSVRAGLSSSGQLSIGQLRATLSSSGTITAAGVCRYSALGVSSSGRLNAAGLAVQDCQARISSSGSCQVNVARTLDAYLSGSGSVVVSGHPQVTSHTSGSGRVRLAQ
jgi:hypothetical protein